MLTLRATLACMRMRKLGKGQSVTFLITQEIQERIRSCAGIGPDAHLAVADALLWSIHETWIDTEKCIPLWAVQGFRHQRQETIWNKSIITCKSNLDLDSQDLEGFF